MTLNHYYRHFRESLYRIYNQNESSKITEMIFEHYMKITKSHVIQYAEQAITEEEEARMNLILEYPMR